MWKDADGKSFGHQLIQDNELTFHTDWINEGGSWMAKIKVKEPRSQKSRENPDLILPKKKYGFIFYLALQVRNFPLFMMFVTDI